MAWTKASEALTKLPAILFHSRFTFSYDGIPIFAEDLSSRQKANLFKLGLSSLLRKDRILGLPAVIQIEPTNICNLKCPLCPSTEKTDSRTHGFMSYAVFQQILGEVGDILIAAYLYSWGEPFLNKDIFRMIEDCTSRNIRTLIPTNGQCLQTREQALAVVDSGLSAIIIAIDGSTQEIYQAYRKGGDVEKVKRCAALIEEAKAERKSPFPYTCLRTVVTRDNQDDLPNIEQLARDLGVNMFSTKTVGCKTWDESFRDFEPTREGLRRFEYEGRERRDRSPIECIFPFRQPTIKWDGTVIGCEFDYDLESPWGTIGKQKFAEIWNGPQARDLRRRIHRGKKGAFCERHCPYQDRIQDGSAIQNLELHPLQVRE